MTGATSETPTAGDDASSPPRLRIYVIPLSVIAIEFATWRLALMDDVSFLLSWARDIAVAVAAVIGSIVGWRGLATWSRKKTDDVARGLLKATYMVREAVNFVRQRSLYSYEDRDESGTLLSPEDARARRWKVVAEAVSEYAARSLEARVQWGDRVEELSTALYGVVNDLEFYLFELRETATSKRAGDHERTAARKRFFEQENDDPLTRKLNAAVEAIEKEMRQHLGS